MPNANIDSEDCANRIQARLAQLESLPDAALRELVSECLADVLSLHGAGLSRILDIVAESSESAVLCEKLAGDADVAALLLIHGLHPVSIETRIQRALEGVSPYIRSHGGDIEVVSIADGVVTLRMHGTCKSCPSSTATLELVVRRAIEEACPDLNGIEVEGLSRHSPAVAHA
jgi:Fe-S cluster biogenesis protein NfuA